MDSTPKLYWDRRSPDQLPGRRWLTCLVTVMDGRPSILDQTAFYPTGGGQPCDHWAGLAPTA
jgi:hypothetical protein